MVDSGEPGNELNLHHEFNPKASEKGLERVMMLVNYILSISNPFDIQYSNKLINIVTLEEVVNSDYFLNCITFGEQQYIKFVKDRLQEKNFSLFATISAKYTPMNDNSVIERKTPKLLPKEAENDNAMKYINCALSRGKTIEYLLEFSITSRPFYLVDSKEPLHLNKPDKARLTKELLNMLDKKDIVTCDEDLPNSIHHVHFDAVVIDFMAYLPEKTNISGTFECHNIWLSL